MPPKPHFLKIHFNISHKKRTKDLWNTRREIQIQTELDQPSRKNGQYKTSETGPQLQTSGEKTSWTPQEKMATRRCRNRSNDLIHGGRWWWSTTGFFKSSLSLRFPYQNFVCTSYSKICKIKLFKWSYKIMFEIITWFEALKDVTIKDVVFWDVTPTSLVVC